MSCRSFLGFVGLMAQESSCKLFRMQLCSSKKFNNKISICMQYIYKRFKKKLASWNFFLSLLMKILNS